MQDGCCVAGVASFFFPQQTQKPKRRQSHPGILMMDLSPGEICFLGRARAAASRDPFLFFLLLFLAEIMHSAQVPLYERNRRKSLGSLWCWSGLY